MSGLWSQFTSCALRPDLTSACCATGWLGYVRVLCERRLAALESSQRHQQPPAQPRHTPAKVKGLTTKDAAIAERLQRLKEATKPGISGRLTVAAAVFVTVSNYLLNSHTLPASG